MAIISANLQFNRGGHGLLDYSSLQKNYSAALVWAQDEDSNAAVGQFIYLEEAETIEGVEYAKGPYVVDAIGEKAVITPLSKSVAGSPDLAGEVSDLKGSVGTLTSDLAKTDASVNALETTVGAISGTYATKEELQEAIGNVDFTELEQTIAGKADASTVYTKEEADGKYVAKEGYVAYTQDEKDKLAGLANIKSVGDNLNVDASGKLTVTIPEVEVPFQSVATDDKLLTLSDGVLKSDVSFGIVGSKIQLTGKDNVLIGEVDTTDFVVDGVLDSVDWSKEQGKENFLVLTWNTDAGKKPMEIDFGKYVDAYSAGEGITLTDKTFAVDYSKVEKAGSAASVEAKLDAYKESNDTILATKVGNDEYSGKMTEIDGSISSIKSDLSNVYTQTEVNDLLSPLAVKADVSTALDLKANANEVYTQTEVNELVSPLATSEALTNGLAAKLDASAKVNGVAFENGEVVIDGCDIALGEAFYRDGEESPVYDATISIQSVIKSLSERIDVLDPNVSGELGISSIVAGNGIYANISGGQATISVKASDVANNMVEVKTDGVYVADMRSYWESI